MTILTAAIIGLIQGLTEILPISSSAHLIIIPTLLNWPVPSLSYDVFLHGATLLSIIIYFRKKLLGILKNAFIQIKSVKSAEKNKVNSSKTLLNLILSALPLIPFYLLTKSITDNITSLPLLVIVLLILFGIPFLVITKWFEKNNKNITDLSKSNALVIGIFQSLSLLSGVSRSGITTIGGLTQGLKKIEAQEYAFISGVITIGGSFLLELFKTINQPLQEPLENLIIGGVVAFISGYLTIGMMMKFIQKHSLSVFGFYRIIIGTLFLLFLYLR